MKIIGLSCYYHDSAAALIIDGKIVAAAQEERFTRKKHDDAFPVNSVKFCLEYSGLSLSDIDLFVYYEKPILKFERLLENFIRFAPFGFPLFLKAMPVWLRQKLFLKSLLQSELSEIQKVPGIESKIFFSEHHLSHAASAFYPSPFDEALVLTMDGVGEWATTSVAIGRGNNLKIIREIHFPHSLGLLYSAMTYFIGFKVNSGEYKVMGLAPYGVPRFKDIILSELVQQKSDGSYQLNLKYFEFPVGLRMTGKKIEKLFGVKTRKPEDHLEQVHMDIAASVQAALEEIILKMVGVLAVEHGIKNLCMAGGVALNCVANGKILQSGLFNRIWVQPASGDAGGAIGAALAAFYSQSKDARRPIELDGMSGTYLGPSYSKVQVEEQLNLAGAVYKWVDSENELLDEVALALSQGKSIGWMNGRMEFGPRALGARSIIADPRGLETQKKLNLQIKFRESFRPFAPAVLSEDLSEWFELEVESPYMLLVAQVRADKCMQMTKEQESLFGIEKLNVPRSKIPAVTHIDYSARVQTVHRETNPRFHALISKFKELTGCPVLVNTSFNVRGEPIVCDPKDAFKCLMGTELDLLVIENAILYRDDQNPNLRLDYKNSFELD